MRKGTDRNPSRGEFGCCDWSETDPYCGELAKMENERHPKFPDDPDPWEIDALAMLDRLVTAACEPDGLGPEDYDAPVGDDVGMNPRPWLGEMKVTGVHRANEGGGREYRLYFSEPDISMRLLKAYLGHKTQDEISGTVRGSNVPLSSRKQTRHMTIALEATKRWCKQENVEYRKYDESPTL